MGRKFAASYTVEASYIMAMTLLALSVLIRSAYAKYQEGTSVMRLHHIVEELRGQEEEVEQNLSMGNWTIEVNRYRDKVEGKLQGGERQKEIIVKVHAPEDMMRKTTIFQAGGSKGEMTEKQKR